METEGFHRAIGLKLCLRCLCIFINPKYERILYTNDDQEVISYIIKTQQLSLDELHNLYPDRVPSPGDARNISHHNRIICSCCLNFFQNSSLQNILNHIHSQVQERSHQYPNSQKLTYSIQFNIPPIIEMLRIGIRTLIYQSVNKLAPSPSFEELYSRYLIHFLQDTLEFVSPEKSDVKIHLDLNCPDEEGLAVAVDPQYRHSHKKRVIGAINQSQIVENYLVNRRDSENLLNAMKTLCGTKNGFHTLTNRILTYCEKRKDDGMIVEGCRSGLLRWDCKLILQPIYLLGRYRKYSRDISQALWTVGSGSEEGGDDECDEDNGVDDDGEDSANPLSTRKRKGRGSVEEFLQEAINRILRCKSCRMHPCGREDIDVRMLGNGRPVVFEVLESEFIPNEHLLSQIVNSINNCEGLNTERDIDLVCLTRVSKDVWTTMQAAAEEKNKAYMCVCWSEKPLNRSILKNLESLPDFDDKGVPCLKLSQKTPARVLHRRSLLSRERYLYEISTCQLNKHYFLLNIITSAGLSPVMFVPHSSFLLGTYVKEFVHGDFGRTNPSVSSLLQCNADILQLDVMWLFDSFEGNSSDHVDMTGDFMYRGAGTEALPVVPWDALRSIPLAHQRDREIK